MRTLLIALAALLTIGTTPAPVATVDIREWPVPWEDTRPRDPAVDKQGRVWFVGQTGDYIARLDPASGKFDRFELEKGVGPHNLIVGAKGEIWFAGNRKGYLGRLDPASGTITKYPMPDPEARDPHTLVAAPDGSIWFTVQGGSFVGRFNPNSTKIDLVKVPTKGARPYGIVVDASGRPWFNEFGTNAIGSIDPKTMKLQEYKLPDAGARGRRIALDRNGMVWYVDYARGTLARLDPKSDKVDEWVTPAGARSLPYAMAADDRGRFWIVETGPQPNMLVGFDPKQNRYFAMAKIPSGGSTVRHMIFHPKTREIWFGTDANTIGRVKVP